MHIFPFLSQSKERKGKKKDKLCLKNKKNVYL